MLLVEAGVTWKSLVFVFDYFLFWFSGYLMQYYLKRAKRVLSVKTHVNFFKRLDKVELLKTSTVEWSAGKITKLLVYKTLGGSTIVTLPISSVFHSTLRNTNIKLYIMHYVCGLCEKNNTKQRPWLIWKDQWKGIKHRVLN